MAGTEKKLSAKTLKKVFNRHYQLLGCFNYERQMSSGYAWTMMPALRELYADEPEQMKTAVKRHLEFFNCATTPSPFIIGISCAMEEQNASAPEEYDASSITAVKAALMGPLAGNVLGPILYFLINVVPSEIVRRYGFKIGYQGGSTFLTRISEDGTLQKLTESARIMGLMVIGAMIPAMVKFNLATVININGAEVILQDMVDQICPKLLPLLLVFACYKALKNKVSGTIIMVALLIFGVLAVALGLL